MLHGVAHTMRVHLHNNQYVKINLRIELKYLFEHTVTCVKERIEVPALLGVEADLVVNNTRENEQPEKKRKN